VATNKENLERWLLIKALLKSNATEEVEKIADKMIKELQDHKEE
jgi:hypothetical protein